MNEVSLQMDIELVRSKVSKAIAILIDQDLFLLKHGVNERSVSHKLAIYLEQEFPGWDVDCEYNRVKDETLDGHNFSKRIEVGRNDQLEEAYVFPDIVVHKRGSEDNLLVIEMKKEGESTKYDREKLEGYVTQLGYKYGFLIIINKNKGWIAPEV